MITQVAGVDTQAGNATNQSDTISVLDLFSIGVTMTDNGFDLLFDINESGRVDDVTIDEFTLFFTVLSAASLGDAGRRRMPAVDQALVSNAVQSHRPL